MSKPVNVKEFAERVERVCEFLLDQIPEKDGSEDLKVIHDLKEDAANLQFQVGQGSLSGLKDFMSGISHTSKE